MPNKELFTVEDEHGKNCWDASQDGLLAFATREQAQLALDEERDSELESQTESVLSVVRYVRAENS